MWDFDASGAFRLQQRRDWLPHLRVRACMAKLRRSVRLTAGQRAATGSDNEALPARCGLASFVGGRDDLPTP